MTLMRWLHSLRLFRLVGVLVCLCAVFANLLKRKWYKGTFVRFLLVLSINDDQCHLNRFWEESGETCVILDFGICNKVLLNKIKYLTQAVVKSTENGKPFDGPFLLWLDLRHTCKFNDTLYKKVHSFFFLMIFNLIHANIEWVCDRRSFQQIFIRHSLFRNTIHLSSLVSLRGFSLIFLDCSIMQNLTVKTNKIYLLGHLLKSDKMD